MGRGIDYGMGQTNRDPETGIRFGVINMNDLAHWAWDEAEADYGEPTCPKCGGSVEDSDGHKDYRCESCERNLWSHEVYGDEPNGHTIDDDGLKAEIDSMGDAFVLESPYFTRAGFCSPCAPGAGDLSSPCDDGEKTYCFGHDWFEDGVAPYPVYLVATGELVPPPAK